MDFRVKRRFVYLLEAGEEMESWLSVGMDSSHINPQLNIALCMVHLLFQTHIKFSSRFEMELSFQKPAQMSTKPLQS